MIIEKNYKKILRQLVAEIKSARITLAQQVNRIAIEVYWRIGKEISDKQLIEGHGSGIVEKLSADLKAEFPEMGLSPRNLWDMKRFYDRYVVANQKLRQLVAVLPWGHNLLIMNKVANDDEAFYYAENSLKNGWSRNLLLNHIKASDYALQKRLPKMSNFAMVLPEVLAEQADEILKSRYNLGFLGVTHQIKELDFERRLVEKIKHFILELGKGFSFVGNQYRLVCGKKEYFVDMLFFHRELKSLVAIELKVGEYKPEYIGKMNFYLTLLDEQVKMPDENPSIGIILCADKDHAEVALSLRDVNKPIAVAEYELLIQKKELRELLRSEFADFKKIKVLKNPKNASRQTKTKKLPPPAKIKRRKKKIVKTKIKRKKKQR